MKDLSLLPVLLPDFVELFNVLILFCCYEFVCVRANLEANFLVGDCGDRLLLVSDQRLSIVR